MTNDDPQFRHYVIKLSPSEIPMWAPRSGPLDYVTAVAGTVQHGRTLGELAPVAAFSFQHVRIDWAKHDGFPLKDLFAADPEWQALYPLLFDPASERLAVATAEESATSDILFVDEMSILPQHRGQRLAGAMLDRLATACFRHWAVMVVRAVPEPIEGGEWSDRVYARPFTASGEAAKKKLRVYWAGFGFRPLGKSDFMVRDVTSLEAAPASLRAL